VKHRSIIYEQRLLRFNNYLPSDRAARRPKNGLENKHANPEVGVLV